MITLIEALNYRCLRDISRPMDGFHVLVGPNASGKTTFLDVVSFLSDLVSHGLEAALETRSSTFQDLLFCREGNKFELAIEASLPESLISKLEGFHYDRIRYEVVIAFDKETALSRIETENLSVKTFHVPVSAPERVLFPEMLTARQTLISKKQKSKSVARTVMTRISTGRANYYSESYKEAGKGWNPQWDLAAGASALANLPADEGKFPVATWFREFLSRTIESIQLDSAAMRMPSSPGKGLKFKKDGSNLPWVIDAFRSRDQTLFQDWIEHLRTALPDLETIRTVEREEDRKRYLKICYTGGLEVPSWLVSDGTLRLLALTLPAYLDNITGVFLIEEPENGVHPRAVETLFESLSHVYNAQVLLATHSPIILSIVESNQVLCFAKDETGATDIISGDEHPRLRDWQHDVPLGDLFAAGVLG